MRSFALSLLFFSALSPAHAEGPAVIHESSSLVYPDFWHTPLGVHRGTPKLLKLLLAGKAQFDDPQGLACTRMRENGPENPQLTVFGVNSGQSCIIYNPDMMSLDLLGSQGSGDFQFNHPNGITALPDGRVAVADTGNNRIVILQYSGKSLHWITTLGKAGKGPAEFNKPGWLAFDSQGRLYVSDTGNNRVQIFSRELQYLYDFGSDPNANNSLIEPQAIAVVDIKEPNSETPEEAIFVVDQFHGRLQKFDLDGNFLGQATGPDADHFLVYFGGIALDYYNNVWVVDRGNHQIHKFDKYLQYVDTWGKKGEGDYRFDSPRGLAIYRHYGQVFVSEREAAQYLWIGADIKDIKVSRGNDSDGQPAMRVDYRLTENALLDCWVEEEEAPHTKLATLIAARKTRLGLESLLWNGKTFDGTRIKPGVYYLVFQAEASYSSATYYKKEARKKFWVK